MSLRRSFFSICLLGLAIAGCTSSTETAAPAVPWRVPGAGTDYTFTTTTKFLATGGIQTNVETSHFTVEATGLSVDGKSNAVRFSSGHDSGYVVYAANGDIMMSDSGENGFTWLVYPTGNHGAIVLPGLDSTDSDGVHYVQSNTRTYDGTERITVTAGSYDAIRIRETTSDTTTLANGSAYTYYKDSHYWFVPSLGFLAKGHEEVRDTGTSSGVPDAEHSEINLELTQVSLK
jgi:hypothetical protein